MAGPDATVYVWLLLTYTVHIWPRNQTFIVASASAVTGSVCMRILRLFLGQCALGGLKRGRGGKIPRDNISGGCGLKSGCIIF